MAAFLPFSLSSPSTPLRLSPSHSSPARIAQKGWRHENREEPITRPPDLTHACRTGTYTYTRIQIRILGITPSFQHTPTLGLQIYRRSMAVRQLKERQRKGEETSLHNHTGRAVTSTSESMHGGDSRGGMSGDERRAGCEGIAWTGKARGEARR
jgi:hypothetical protein